MEPSFPGAPRGRLIALDAHRGLLMVLMAIDHASYFIARVHSAEFWGMALPTYSSAYWFLTRWVTHLCAPGFFFLMGIGMTLLATSHLKTGWGESRITRFFVTRGLFLILLQILIEDTAWNVGDLFVNPGTMVFRGGVPGGGTGGMIYLGVLFALGGAMVFWAFVRRAPLWFIALISLLSAAATQFLTPGPDQTGILYSPLVRMLMIPGHTNMWVVFYPLVPWLGVTGMGLLFGELLQRDADRAGRIAGWTGMGFLMLFVILRAIGGFGNLNEVPPGVMGFLNVTKYPPALDFLMVTMGMNLLLMALWGRLVPSLQNNHHPLLVFGRVALFFYLLHLWVYGLLGFLSAGGSGLGTMYGFWLLGLLILYPVCYWYNGFKHRKPLTSVWRFF